MRKIRSIKEKARFAEIVIALLQTGTGNYVTWLP